MMESDCQEVWNTWELVSEIKPRGWKKQKREQEEMCAEDWYQQEDERIQEGLCEDRYQRSSPEGSGVAGKKPSISLSLFLEINNLEIEHELACAATCSWAGAVRTGNREDDMREAWQWQVLESLVGQLEDIKQTLKCLAKDVHWQNVP